MGNWRRTDGQRRPRTLRRCWTSDRGSTDWRDPKVRCGERARRRREFKADVSTIEGNKTWTNGRKFCHRERCRRVSERAVAAAAKHIGRRRNRMGISLEESGGNAKDGFSTYKRGGEGINSDGFKVYKGGRQTDSYLCHNMARSVFFAPLLDGSSLAQRSGSRQQLSV